MYFQCFFFGCNIDEYFVGIYRYFFENFQQFDWLDGLSLRKVSYEFGYFDELGYFVVV